MVDTTPAPTEQPAHLNGAASLSATPAGAETEASDYDGRPDLCDAEYSVAHTLTGHSRAVSSVRFSHSGACLATASADGTARIWNTDTGTCIAVLQGHAKGLSDVAWAPGDDYLATASDDRTVRVWEAQTGTLLRVLRGHTHYVMSCAFSASGALLASAGFDETVVVWDVVAGTAIRTIPAHSDPISCVAFSGELHAPAIMSTSFDGLIRLWSADTGNCLASLLATGGPPTSFGCFTPNDKYVLTGRMDSKLVMWNYRNKQPIRTFEGHKNTKYCLQAAISTVCPGHMDEEGAPPALVICGSEDHHVYVWAVNGSRAGTAPLLGILRGRPSAQAPGEGHCDAVLSVTTHPTQPIIASAGHERDRTVKIWKHDSLA